MGDSFLKLQKLIINGFRSFGTKTVVEFSKENAFIGNNGSGKTSCLLAMNKMFSLNPSERIITKKDFYVCSDNKDALSRRLMIEAIFQLDNVLNDKDQNAEGEYWNRLLVESNESCPILRIRLNAEWTNDGSAEGSIDTKYSFILSPENTNEKNEKSQLARRSELSSIRFIYIPATRNPEKQLGTASGALITHLIKKVKWSDGVKDSLIKLGSNMNDTFWKEKGAQVLQNSIQSEWSSLNPDERYSRIQMDLSSINLDDLINQVQFSFQSSITDNKYSIKEMSDGIKSLFYISNIASLLDVEQGIDDEEKIIDIKKPVLTMFALEEPENHISPHLLGNLMSKLGEISNLVNTQVFITSHSPAIIKRVNPKQIRYFRLNNNGTEIRKLELPSEHDEAYKFIKKGVQLYPELYFSKLVIIGEGDSEEIVLSRIFNNYSGLDKAEISVIPLGGRYINYIWRLLKNLDIQFITLLDLDMERYQGGTKRINYILDNLEKFNGKNETILKLRSDLGEANGDREKLLKIVKEMEKFDVFLSSPLDLDFMMLQSFPEEYKSNLKRGPRKISIDAVLNSVLKGKRTSGNMYTQEEKDLMRYYNTLFLNIGKPITHIEALEKIDDKKLNEQLPETLKNLANCAKRKISGEAGRQEK